MYRTTLQKQRVFLVLETYLRGNQVPHPSHAHLSLGEALWLVPCKNTEATLVRLLAPHSDIKTFISPPAQRAFILKRTHCTFIVNFFLVVYLDDS